MEESTHILQQTEEFLRGRRLHRKRRRAPVQGLLGVQQQERRGFESSFFCAKCSSKFGGRVALCPRVRREHTGLATLTWPDLA